ncbi:NUDIX hydrolase [Turicibacter sp.]|uniref:NUDIX hydrolase n=1 Tax=Turicibacter sp. TaxID=2049042 RepID=UPI00257DFE88|nr:NUDIX hydrolase [Turicibacter sp.]
MDLQTEGVFTIVVNKKQEVLLVKRKDLPIWDLPGGRVDERELLEEAAKREVREETGYEVEIVDKVGVYDRSSFHDVQHIYTGIVTGG